MLARIYPLTRNMRQPVMIFKIMKCRIKDPQTRPNRGLSGFGRKAKIGPRVFSEGSKSKVRPVIALRAERRDILEADLILCSRPESTGCYNIFPRSAAE